MSGGGGDSRVSIPNTVRKLIQEVKKTLGSFKYTDDFIYATLKDCDLNVNESSRRLKIIHDIREIAGKHSVEDVYTMLIECNIDPNDAVQRLLYIDTFHEVKKKQDRRKSMISYTSEELKQTGGNQLWGARGGRGTLYSSKAFDDGGGGRNLSSGKEYCVTNRREKVSRLTLPVNSGKENNVKHVADSSANNNGTPALSNGMPAVSNGNYSHKLAPKLPADVSSHSPESVVVSSQNIRQTCSVGSIKFESVKRSGNIESNSRISAGMKFSADQVGAGTAPVISQAADSDKPKQQNSDVVVKNQAFVSLQPPLLSTQDGSHVVDPIQDNQPFQLLNEPLKVTTSEHKTVSINNMHSIPEEESELKISAAKPDVMLEKLTLYSHQPVIFPDHLQVQENYKSQFTFGSLDGIFDDPGPLSVTESIQKNGEVVTEPSLSNQNVPTTAQEDEIQDNPLSDFSNHVLPSQDNISSDPALKHELHTKNEMTFPDGGSLNPALQNTRDYSYGFMPHLMGPHFVQLDVPELQNGSSPVASTLGPTPVTQAALAGQGSMALSPPLFPYFRQPYPNYIPYNQYFPHMYMPHNVHLINHGVFSQQPPTGNVHMQAGVKFPAPSQYKQGSNEEVNAPQAKDSNTHPAVQQGEDPQVWAPVAGRDVPNILPNYFYNFPQGQHMTFSPLPAGLYYSSQTMTAESTVQSLVYPSHSSFGPVETMVQPTSSYRQPQHALQTELPDRETS